MFNDIYELMINGQWANAIEKFKSINPTAREFQDYLESLEDVEALRDFSLLGFYAREYTGGNYVD